MATAAAQRSDGTSVFAGVRNNVMCSLALLARRAVIIFVGGCARSDALLLDGILSLSGLKSLWFAMETRFYVISQ